MLMEENEDTIVFMYKYSKLNAKAKKEFEEYFANLKNLENGI